MIADYCMELWQRSTKNKSWFIYSPNILLNKTTFVVLYKVTLSFLYKCRLVTPMINVVSSLNLKWAAAWMNAKTHLVWQNKGVWLSAAWIYACQRCSILLKNVGEATRQFINTLSDSLETMEDEHPASLSVWSWSWTSSLRERKTKSSQEWMTDSWHSGIYDSQYHWEIIWNQGATFRTFFHKIGAMLQNFQQIHICFH